MKKKKSAVTPCKTMRGHTKCVFGVAHLPGRKRIITCSEDNTLRLWDLENSAQIGGEWRDKGDKSEIRAMALSPNGKTIASGSLDGTVRLWDVETRKVLHKWKAHRGFVMSLCWSPNSERVVSGSNDRTTRVWDAKSGKPVQGLNPMKRSEHVSAVSYSPGAKMIASGVQDMQIVIWDAKTGKRLSKIELKERVQSLAWTSENKLIVGSFGSIRIFDTATWQCIADLVGPPGTPVGDVVSLTLFQNDRFLASTSYDTTVRLWDLDTNREVSPPLQHEAGVTCAAFSADGKLLSTACYDGNAYVWDIYAILKAAGLEDLLSDVSTNLTVIRDLIHNECQAQKSVKVCIIRGFSRLMKHAYAPTRTSRYQMYVPPFSDLETDSDVDILGQCYPTSTHSSNPRATSSATRLFRWCTKL
jgi:WD40 repeat protein